MTVTKENINPYKKWFSMFETREASGVYRLLPAYDLLPVMPEDPELFALAISFPLALAGW
ncbi:MAG: hypothetical protein J5938_05400 [Clostridia bacterium]|nr:hypothetical protein [Clostridia bacterium]